MGWLGRRRRPVDRWFTVNEVVHSDDVVESAIRYIRVKGCVSTRNADTSDASVLEHDSDERKAIICGRNESSPERVSSSIEVLNRAALWQIDIGEHGSESVDEGGSSRTGNEEVHVGYGTAQRREQPGALNVVKIPG
jgi:hypothetical protein